MALATDSTSPAPDIANDITDLPESIRLAVKARLPLLVSQADTLTLPKVRRMIEKDLKLEPNFLDAHKSIFKSCIDKMINSSDADEPSVSESPKKRKLEKPDTEHSNGTEVKVESTDIDRQTKKRLKKIHGERDEEEKVPKQLECEEIRNTEESKEQIEEHIGVKEEVNMEALIREAAYKRASEFKSQADSFTLSGVRQLLEEDLKLEPGHLNAQKKFVRGLMDELLNSEELDDPVSIKEPTKRKAAGAKAQKGLGVSTSKEKPKKAANKQEAAPVEEEEDGAEEHSEDKEEVEEGKEDEDEDEDVEASDDDTGRKKARKPKKVVESKPVSGKKVEHLKTIIKACGITVPPSVYRKAKQARDEKREVVLMEELDAILKRQGLSANASKDDIKAVRKQLEKRKDLEGIDSSNIIVESRGRRATAANFFAPKYKEPVDLSDEEDEDEESNSEEDPNVDPQEEEEEEEDD